MHEQAHHTSTRSLLSFSSSSSSSSESITLAVTPPVKVGKLKTSAYVARLDEVRRPTLVLPPTGAAGGVGGPHVSALPRRRRKASPNAVTVPPNAPPTSGGSARTRPSSRPLRKRRPTVGLGRNVSLGFADSDVEDEELERGWDVVLRVVLDEDEVAEKGKGKETEASEGTRGEEEGDGKKVTRLVVPASKAAHDDGVPILQGDDVRRALERVSNALLARGVLDANSASPTQPSTTPFDSSSRLTASPPSSSSPPLPLSRSPTAPPNLPTILILAPPSRPTDGLVLALCVMSASYPRPSSALGSTSASPLTTCRPLLPTFLSAIQELATSASPSSPTTTDPPSSPIPPPHTFSTPALLLMHLHDMDLFAESEDADLTPLQREAERERQRFRGCLSAEGVEWVERILSA